jgi:hypothetical protein
MSPKDLALKYQTDAKSYLSSLTFKEKSKYLYKITRNAWFEIEPKQPFYNPEQFIVAKEVLKIESGFSDLSKSEIVGVRGLAVGMKILNMLIPYIEQRYNKKVDIKISNKNVFEVNRKGCTIHVDKNIFNINTKTYAKIELTERVDVFVATALHEIYHFVHTSISYITNIEPNTFFLLNVFEDLRIEEFLMQDFEGINNSLITAIHYELCVKQPKYDIFEHKNDKNILLDMVCLMTRNFNYGLKPYINSVKHLAFVKRNEIKIGAIYMYLKNILGVPIQAYKIEDTKHALEIASFIFEVINSESENSENSESENSENSENSESENSENSESENSENSESENSENSESENSDFLNDIPDLQDMFNDKLSTKIQKPSQKVLEILSAQYPNISKDIIRKILKCKVIDEEVEKSSDLELFKFKEVLSTLPNAEVIKLRRTAFLYNESSTHTEWVNYGESLDSNKLSGVGAGNLSIFKKSEIIKNKKILVCMLVDESASMYNENRIGYARNAAIGVAYAHYDNPSVELCVYGHSADSVETSYNTCNLFCYLDHSSKKNLKNLSKLIKINCKLNNRDGDAIQYIVNKIDNCSKFMDSKKLLIVLSDGLPSAQNYDVGVEHTKSVIKEVENKGFWKILHVTVCKSAEKNGEAMYKHFTKFTEPNKIFEVLSKQIQKLFN